MNSFDLSLFNIVHGVADRWFLLDWLAIFFAVYLGYILVVIFLLTAAREKDRKKRFYALAWWALAAIVSRGIVTEVIYFFYQRTRPFVALGIEPVFNHATTASFPSSHMTFYATLVIPMYYLDKKWGWLFGFGVVGMAIGRIYGAVHWPLDILGGLAIAFAAVYGVKYALFRGSVISETKEKEEQAKEDE